MSLGTLGAYPPVAFGLFPMSRLAPVLVAIPGYPRTTVFRATQGRTSRSTPASAAPARGIRTRAMPAITGTATTKRSATGRIRAAAPTAAPSASDFPSVAGNPRRVMQAAASTVVVNAVSGMRRPV
jgi:hypothetical protein